MTALVFTAGLNRQAFPKLTRHRLAPERRAGEEPFTLDLHVAAPPLCDCIEGPGIYSWLWST